jgi:hypothetical protein
MQLEEMGWDGFFASQQLLVCREWHGVAGRIAAGNRGQFVVWTEAGEVAATVCGPGPGRWRLDLRTSRRWRGVAGFEIVRIAASRAARFGTAE